MAGAYVSLLKRLDWFGRTSWARYLPAEHPDCSPRYITRLAQWVDNTQNEETQKLLLRFAERVAFFSHEDFGALYHSAFTGPIMRWVINCAALKISAPDFQPRLHEELHRCTWFCPVTDSMNISEFYHCNHLSGISHRPSFATLAMLDDRVDPSGPSQLIPNLSAFMASPDTRLNAPPLERVVLLEDFVGSGTQTKPTVEWAIEHLKKPILFVPLTICPQGRKIFEELAAKHVGRFTFAPVLSVETSDLLGPQRLPGHGGGDAELMEEFARDSFERVAGGKLSNRFQKPYDPFGWEETGCSIVTYSNTPNNTLPLVHHQPPSKGWKPLFPRSARI